MNRIVIVGGGTAGWLSACLIASRAARLPMERLAVTLVEAPNIPTIGVGEGTWPTMRATLSEIGLDEADVLRSCDAALKQGSRFDGWVSGAPGDSYYHPFTPPPDGTALDLVAAWRELAPDAPFALAVSAQPAVCEAQLAPRQSAMPGFAGALNYAYHLDAAKLAARLSRHACSLGVRHVRDEVTGVDAGADGTIDSLRTRAGETIGGDLFIDCSGSRGLLIEGHCGSAWIGRGDILPNDRALAAQVAVDPGSPIESQTIGTAHEAGWLWDIGLPTRRGIGCVYSSQFMDDAAADAVLRNYVARFAGDSAATALTPRALQFRSGHRETFWSGNCLAIGQSAGFIEPLEASAIVMIELSLRTLTDSFPASRQVMHIHAERFNALFRTRWERIVEFLKLHYVLSRRDEPYWRAQRDPATISPRLQDLLALWRDHPPAASDLPLAEEVFPAASYQYVYYGMGGAAPGRLPSASEAMRRQFDQLRHRSRALLSTLPTNRALLNSVAAAAPCDKAVQP
ncbi:MAG: tryptophan halogenase family protein [Sphingomicrobium sp.]